jgi:serine/threonine protein kinase
MSKKSSELVGKTVKGYKIIKSIGEGKFSEVYRAETENKIPYAMKNIKVFKLTNKYRYSIWLIKNQEINV